MVFLSCRLLPLQQQLQTQQHRSSFAVSLHSTQHAAACCRWFSFISNLFTTAVSVLFLVNWYMPKLWSASTALAVHFGYNLSHEVLITVIYNLLDSSKDLLLGLPFGLYSTFVVEQRHGFNKQSLGLFIKDQVIAVCSAHQHCNVSTEIQIEIQLGHVQHVYLLLLPLQISSPSLLRHRQVSVNICQLGYSFASWFLHSTCKLVICEAFQADAKSFMH